MCYNTETFSLHCQVTVYNISHLIIELVILLLCEKCALDERTNLFFPVCKKAQTSLLFKRLLLFHYVMVTYGESQKNPERWCLLKMDVQN